ncbi:hypothetical protein TRICHSKD4_2738 [Roseibium sp. TrichSKD4]|uniref:hypothetical protein n=1 Tax=Roseibium sp. TrichSKD4 TaxID=744980 RepID=UPI0001E5705E|nr:hypothetical protein [Roseibium sp. TrichSKD4]EFO31651.1 hypothetical protein TRICHSKD4_2738 [Roseibium sp. TrichSKD4]
MSRLANTADGLSEVTNLRLRRNELLARAYKLRFRKCRQRELHDQIEEITKDLLRLELEARAQPAPLGDAGSVGNQIQPRLPYKD